MQLRCSRQRAGDLPGHQVAAQYCRPASLTSHVLLPQSGAAGLPAAAGEQATEVAQAAAAGGPTSGAHDGSSDGLLLYMPGAPSSPLALFLLETEAAGGPKDSQVCLALMVVAPV